MYFKFVNYWHTGMCVCYNEVRPLHGVATTGSEAKRIEIEIPASGQKKGGRESPFSSYTARVLLDYSPIHIDTI